MCGKGVDMSGGGGEEVGRQDFYIIFGFSEK